MELNLFVINTVSFTRVNTSNWTTLREFSNKKFILFAAQQRGWNCFLFKIKMSRRTLMQRGEPRATRLLAESNGKKE